MMMSKVAGHENQPRFRDCTWQFGQKDSHFNEFFSSLNFVVCFSFPRNSKIFLQKYPH